MTDYLYLLTIRDNFFKEFNQIAKEANDNSVKDNRAATDIQRLFRGSSCRVKISKKQYIANEIQRVFRGLIGRKKSEEMLQKKLMDRQASMFHYFCIQIQRSFRGYYSRKYKRDHAKRKNYVKTLVEQGQRVRAEMENYAKLLAEREATEEEEKRKKEFNHLATNLHHLVSTQHVPGIYNPSLEFIEKPTMNSTLVEEHIRGVVKDLLRTRGIAKTGLITDINGTKKIPLKGLKYRLSIQASEPFDTLEKERRRAQAAHRILRMGPKDFFAGGKTELINQNLVPLSVDDPYIDPWANPMLMKGVPINQKQLLESSWNRKALFAPPIEKPFTTRVGGNKSTTLPNDIFDVIAEAEETGGAIQRQLGTTTSRFGLPASADNRLDGMIPKPPIRTSAMLTSTRARGTIYLDGTAANSKLLKTTASIAHILPSTPPGKRKKKDSNSSRRPDNDDDDDSSVSDLFQSSLPTEDCNEDSSEDEF